MSMNQNCTGLEEPDLARLRKNVIVQETDRALFKSLAGAREPNWCESTLAKYRAALVVCTQDYAPPTTVPHASDTARLDFMQATEQTPWRVEHDEWVWSTVHPEQKENRRVFDGWSTQMEVDDPYPTIREAIDAAMSALAYPQAKEPQ